MFSPALLILTIVSCVSAAPNINVVRLTLNKTDELPSVSPFIVGGSNAAIEDNPHIVSLLLNCGSLGTRLCGGSIIHPGWILTAAHCFYEEEVFVVLSGTVRVASIYYNSGGNQHSITEVYHFGYTYYNMLHDIALVKVTPIINVGRLICDSIYLPPQGSRPPTGATVKIAGWGTTSEDGPLPKQLQSANVTIIDQTICRRSYGSSIQDSMFCAGVTGGGIDSCQGDSGGPVVYPPTGKSSEVVGIVSFGYKCARPNYPGVYTNVGDYVDIINFVIQNS